MSPQKSTSILNDMAQQMGNVAATSDRGLMNLFHVYQNTEIPKIEEVWGVSYLDKKLDTAKKFLGERWLLHPVHSPKKGDYDPWSKK